MPIASAISGMEMPGRDRTSSSACWGRVPRPRGGRRRRLPLPLEPPAARRDVPDPPDARPRRVGGPPLAAPVDRPPPPPSSAAAAASRRGKFSARGGSSLQRPVVSRLFFFPEIGLLPPHLTPH